jgi:transposase
MIAVVHQSLKERDLLSAEHLVDSPREHGVTIVGPVADDPSWQARAEDGIDKSQFIVEWKW